MHTFIHKMFVSILQRKLESTEYFVQVLLNKTLKRVKKKNTVGQKKKIVYKTVEMNIFWRDKTQDMKTNKIIKKQIAHFFFFFI